MPLKVKIIHIYISYLMYEHLSNMILNLDVAFWPNSEFCLTSGFMSLSTNCNCVEMVSCLPGLNQY